ncbi:MAG: aromatic-ring-hydroxylating dioxygenase subunit beta [Pseudomonadota bacterium]|nr:aromatic-ring-hydroxylating dioxygenase subunit beta [Pseudomonadota bacterium]
MSGDTQQLGEASKLLFEEAACLDERRWDDWLALYTEDCEYWVPAWKNQFETTGDPESEVSLIYYADRSGLEERVWRIRSDAAPAHRLLPRTCHAINNIRVTLNPQGLRVHANWRVDYYVEKRSGVFFGFYDMALVKPDSDWRIARKKITLLNDCVPSYLDVYQL